MGRSMRQPTILHHLQNEELWWWSDIMDIISECKWDNFRGTDHTAQFRGSKRTGAVPGNNETIDTLQWSGVIYFSWPSSSSGRWRRKTKISRWTFSTDLKKSSRQTDEAIENHQSHTESFKILLAASTWAR